MCHLKPGARTPTQGKGRRGMKPSLVMQPPLTEDLVCVRSVCAHRCAQVCTCVCIYDWASILLLLYLRCLGSRVPTFAPVCLGPHLGEPWRL